MNFLMSQLQPLHVLINLLKRNDFYLILQFLLKIMEMSLIIFRESLNAISLLLFLRQIFIRKLFYPFSLILQLKLMLIECGLYSKFQTIFGLNQQVILQASSLLVDVEAEMLVLVIQLDSILIKKLNQCDLFHFQLVEWNLLVLLLMDRQYQLKGFFYHLFSLNLIKVIVVDFMLEFNHRYFPF